MGMKKTTSLKASFWKFLCMLLMGLIGAVAIPFSLILAGTSTGLITYANYSERYTKDLAPGIATAPISPINSIYKNFQKDVFSDVVFFIPIYTQSPRLSLSAEYPVCSILTGYS